MPRRSGATRNTVFRMQVASAGPPEAGAPSPAERRGDGTRLAGEPPVAAATYQPRAMEGTVRRFRPTPFGGMWFAVEEGKLVIASPDA